MAELQTGQTGLNGPRVRDYRGFAGGRGRAARGIAAPFPSRPGRKDPRKRECTWRRATAEPPIGDPRGCAGGGWEKQRLNSSARSRRDQWMCVQSVARAWLWLNRRNKGDRKGAFFFFLGLTPNFCRNSYFLLALSDATVGERSVQPRGAVEAVGVLQRRQTPLPLLSSWPPDSRGLGTRGCRRPRNSARSFMPQSNTQRELCLRWKMSFRGPPTGIS